MKRVLTELLNLPEVVVESSLKEGKTLILSVAKKTKSAVCPQCVQKSEIGNRKSEVVPTTSVVGLK